MLRKMYRFFLMSLLFVSFVASMTARPAVAEVNDDYALKISLENQLEKKMKQVIQEITGTDKFVIFVNVELMSTKSSPEKVIEKKKGGALVLPGVPEKTEIGSSSSSPSELVLGGGSSKYSVSKIVLSMWIDKSVPGTIVDLIQDVAGNAIGFNKTRGDQINIKKVDFESKKFYFGSLFMPPDIFLLLLTIFGGFMCVSVGLFFLDPMKKLVAAMKEIDWNTVRGASVAATTEKTSALEREMVSTSIGKENAALSSGDQEAALPFAFIKDRDIASLAFLLKDRQIQDVALVANYLDPVLAIRLMEAFPKDKQVEIAVILAKEEIGTDKVPALEQLIKEKLAYVVGGENKLLSVLDMAGDDVRDKIVKTLETKDAQTATRIKQRVKSFENIVRELTPQGIQALYRNVNASLFAQIVKSSPEDLQQKIISSLSAGAAERLKEEISLSRALSSIRLKREKQNLMVILRRLISEGIVEVENS